MKKYLLLLLVLLVASSVFAQKKEKQKKEDKPDRNFRFAGIPLIGYNRTVEFSLGAILTGYYKVNQKDTISPESSTMLIGMGTTNKSYFGAFVQQFYLDEDKWRIKLVGGFGNANLQVWTDYGTAGQFIDYATLVAMVSLDVKRKVYKQFYIGIYGALASAETTFDVTDSATGEKYTDTQKLNNAGFNLLWDSRDNVNYPTEGFQVLMNNRFYASWMGNDSSFTKVELTYNQYLNFNSERKVLLIRYFSKMSFGEVPFQGQNTVRADDIRGYSQGKYRDKQIYTVQAEYRHRFKNRWGFVAFAGVAAAVPEFKGLFNTTYLPGAGAGVRFLLIKKMGINIGIDVGVGRDDWSLTFRVGEAFSR